MENDQNFQVPTSEGYQMLYKNQEREKKRFDLVKECHNTSDNQS